MDDLISRQAAIDAVIKRDANCGIDSAEVLKTLSSAQPELEKKIKEIGYTGKEGIEKDPNETFGEWLDHDGVYRCSECGYQIYTEKALLPDECPICGRTMINWEEEEDG